MAAFAKFAASRGHSVVYIDTEDGLLESPKGVDVVSEYSYGAVIQLMQKLGRKDIVILDTIDGLALNARRAVAASEGKSSVVQIPYGRGVALVKDTLVSAYLFLAEKADLFICVSHSKRDAEGVVKPTTGYTSASEDVVYDVLSQSHIVAYMPRPGFVVANNMADHKRDKEDEGPTVVVKSRVQVPAGEIPLQTLIGIVYKAFLKRKGVDSGDSAGSSNNITHNEPDMEVSDVAQ
jgi:hypothetical protein